MLHVLRHYLPLRKALLVLSETALLTASVGAGMTAHIWTSESSVVVRQIAMAGLTPNQAGFRCVVSAFLIALVAQVAFAFNELYDFRVSGSRYERFSRFLGSSGIAIALSLALLYLAQLWQLERVFDFPGLTLSQAAQALVFSLLLGFALLYSWRYAFHRLLRLFRFDERVLILGQGRVARTLIGEMRGRAFSGYEVVGVLADPTPRETGTLGQGEDPLGGAVRFAAPGNREDGERRRQAPAGPPRTSPPGPGEVASGQEAAELLSPRVEPTKGESLLELAQRLRVDDIVVALEDRRGTMPTQELLDCRLAGLIVEEGEALYERMTGKIAVEAMRPSYLIFNAGFVKHPFSEAGKRVFDLVLASAILVAALPAIVLTAIAVRFDSKGPILFRQERTGRFDQPFTLLKFRSMRADAEKSTGPVWAQANDPRITRVGRFIRKTRLDELPQLLNVLGGSMSMVGPRPERPHFVADLAQQIPYYNQRHIVKPGLTGWAQINYPYGNTVEDALQKLQYDLFYIKYRSLPFDLSIVINTIKTVVLRRGT